MIIKIHSIADIITNSSSVEYVLAEKETVKIMKKFLEAILKAAGCSKTVDELFEVKLVEDPAYKKAIEYALGEIEEYDPAEDEFDPNQATAIQISTKEGIVITPDIQKAFEAITISD